MRTARGVAAVAAAVLAVALSACMPTPAPTPTPTGFASEEEAFAAAEATYRAYVDATNARRDDPDSNPDPVEFLTGNALQSELETREWLESEALRIVGDSTITSVARDRISASAVFMTFCLDASTSRVLDQYGADVTPEDRVDVLGVDVRFIGSSSPLLISESTTSEHSCL